MKTKTHPYQELFIFNLTQEVYLQNQMNKVSRSFAVVVAPQEQPLRGFLSTAYLVCRVADNIEDCRQTYEWKEKHFGEFKGVLADHSNVLEVLEFWEAENWPNLTPDELKLMGSSVGCDLWCINYDIPLSELNTATEYVTNLPTKVGGYRRASLLCLLPALQTNLLAARKNVNFFTSNHNYKISCFSLAKCMLNSRRLARNNDQIRAYSEILQGEIKNILRNTPESTWCIAF